MRFIPWTCALILVAAALGAGASPVSIPSRRQIPVEIVRYLQGSADHPMLMPTDICIDGQGKAYVCDGVNDRVLVFTPDGTIDRSIGSQTGLTLRQPVGLAMDPNDRLWIADTGNHRLVIVSAQGRLIESVRLPDSDQAHLRDPTDVVVTPDLKRCYVVDNDNHCLLIRDNRKGTWKIMGKKGRALEQFEYPFMVCLGTENYVYVSETMGARLHRVSPRDQWSGIMGRWGVELGQFYRPKGVVADRKGNIFVSDSTIGVVQVFGPWGHFMGVLCHANGQPFYFDHPMGMCFGRDGRLHIVELAKNRVAICSFPHDEHAAKSDAGKSNSLTGDNR